MQNLTSSIQKHFNGIFILKLPVFQWKDTEKKIWREIFIKKPQKNRMCDRFSDICMQV